jgi:hypothetical protein
MSVAGRDQRSRDQRNQFQPAAMVPLCLAKIQPSPWRMVFWRWTGRSPLTLYGSMQIHSAGRSIELPGTTG